MERRDETCKHPFKDRTCGGKEKVLRLRLSLEKRNEGGAEFANTEGLQVRWEIPQHCLKTKRLLRS